MAEKMPKDIRDALYELDNPDDIERIQKTWLEYAKINDSYERDYPNQLGNLVEGNLKFKENKTIPTPAEQMRQFNDSIREELNEIRGKTTKEQVYEMEDQQPIAENPKEHNISWVKDYYDQQKDQVTERRSEQPEKTETPTEKDRNAKMKDFKLTFDTMDAETQQQNPSLEVEAEREDIEHERD